MNSKLGHVQINVAPENLPFYRDLANHFGWGTLVDSEGMYGAGAANQASLWFIGQHNGAANDYDGPGMNHLGVQVERPADVDATVSYLQERNIPALFETPRHRPEFAQDEQNTYYQVMFESPDRVLFEVVYIGPKA